MKRFSLLLLLTATTSLHAYDFQVGCFHYNITNNTLPPFTVELARLEDEQKELREIAELYINDRDYEKASQINSVLQDTEINRRLAESTYYEQYKEDLESTIANSKEEENVENAKKELEQVNIILNND